MAPIRTSKHEFWIHQRFQIDLYQEKLAATYYCSTMVSKGNAIEAAIDQRKKSFL